MTGVRFYSWARSSGSRVHWALEELAIQYEYVALDRCGHVPWLERAAREDFLHALRAWLANH